MESIKLELGKRYLRRDGQISGVIRRNTGLVYPYRDAASCYTYNERGRYFSYTEDSWDLIELYEPTPQKYNPDSTGGLKYDSGKLLFSCLTRGLAIPLRAVAAVLTYGAMKYKRDSWQNVQNGEERYEDALDRHLNAWKSGETYDAESGLPHLAHAACNALFLIWFEHQHTIAYNVTEFNDPTKGTTNE